MLKLIPVSPISGSTSSSEIYEEKSVKSGNTSEIKDKFNKKRSNLKTSLRNNFSPILSRLRKISKPVIQPKKEEYEEIRKKQIETKFHALENKAQKLMHLFNQRVKVDNVSERPLKLNSFHKYESTYADLRLAKKILQMPNKHANVSYKRILVTEIPIKVFREYELVELTRIQYRDQPSQQSRSFNLNQNNSQYSQKSEKISDIKKTETIKRYISLTPATVTPQHVLYNKKSKSVTPTKASKTQITTKPNNMMSPIEYTNRWIQ